MNPEKVSIIIPVYNVEPYLAQCLDSAIHQDYDNIEIIAINDGSTDASLSILEEFRTKHKNIIIKNIENQGVSVARNTGLEIATGEYISFLDSD
ncbi:glycosyltransferase family 2 protein, partial [Azotobacter armeniacus]